jgi:endonuclease/exonuclease/phosphatase family metal-dependent hydrolase
MFRTAMLCVGLFAVLFSTATSLAIAKDAASLRVMTFNIRYGTASDGENHWDKRKEFLLESIKRFDPDLLGTQETLGFQRDYLAEKLAGYAVEGVGRDDGKEKGEMMALCYRKNRFERLDSGHFWLSEAPEKIGSKSWDSSLPRMVTWVKLKDLKNPTAKPIAFFNTHFDHRGPTARLESAKLIRKKMIERAADCRVILTGDFNADAESDPYKALFAGEDAPVVDAYRKKHPEKKENEGTFSGFKASEVKGARIDWIGCSRDFTVEDCQIDRTEKEGRSASDHFAVWAVLK